MIDTSEITEKVILFAVDTGSGDDVSKSLEELSELVKTAGAICVGTLIQNLDHPETATYLGSGKCEELRALIEASDATGCVCDDELTPMQLEHLTEILGVKVLDRTMVILDIFAGRAKTREGKVQVEMAQLKFSMKRLVGMRNSLSRLGGGIGTRGPGETKLEIDRRVIRNRVSQLERELDDIKKHREIIRKQRSESKKPTVAIVGYTNAGKSTLINRLTDAGVLAEDKLFATLDPTSRSYTLESGQEIILTDTVGFIRKLPHHLVNAFHSTLTEAMYADILLHVVDISNPEADRQILTVYDTLRSLGIKDKPVITVMNKIDLVDEIPPVKDLSADRVIYLSAASSVGFSELDQAIDDVINAGRRYVETLIPYQNAAVISKIRSYGTLLSEDYRDDGIFIKAYVDHTMEL